jgi:putative nucleotidyltransferase with HDIG domain
MTVASPTLTEAAERTARLLLADMGDRWRHTRGVAGRAAELAAALHLDADLLVAAAWLHDIGYADCVRDTGFHPIDGARHLRGQGWPAHVSGLVAHHSGARFAAAARGLTRALAAFPDGPAPISDALTYADQTVGPDGTRVTPAQRRAEMLRRHGPGSCNAEVDHLRGPHLLAVARRVERLLCAPVAAR